MLFADMVHLYESYGVRIRSSMSPYLLEKISNHPDEDGQATYLIENGVNISHLGGGIGMSEVALVEDLGRTIAPRNVFGVGCSFGWSTIALALAFPAARVVAIDAGWGEGKRGIEFTNRIAADRGLNCKAVLASSPQDVPAVATGELDGPIDFVFVDGDHRNEAQTRDFLAVKPFCAPDAVYMFHDVMLCGMLPSFQEIWSHLPGYVPRILTRTLTGIGVIAPASAPAPLHKLLQAYCDPFCSQGFKQIHV
jgi:predicted O-methyltransferase YrrM